MKPHENLPPREILERLKIETEIKELKKPFYKQKEFFIAIIPIALGIIGLIFSWASGYFDVKLREVQVSKDELELKISELKKDKENLYENYRNDSILLLEKYENKEIKLEIDYQEKNAKLEEEYQAKIATRVSESEQIEIRLKQRIDNLDLSNSANKETIKDLVKQNENDKVIISALRTENDEVKRKLGAASENLDEVFLIKQKYKLITFFLYNRKYEWLGFKQTKSMVGDDYSPEVLKKLIDQNPDIFFEYITNLKNDTKGIAINLDTQWGKIK